MENLDKLLAEAAALHGTVLETAGAFFFEPFGIQSSPLLNGIAVYAVVLVAALFAYRLTRPVHRARAHHHRAEYHFGRNR